MQLKDIINNKGAKVWSVKTSQTLQDALEQLVHNKVGALLAMDDQGSVAGVISERDIMRACYENPSDWAQIAVEKVMTQRVIVVSPEDEVDYAMGVMTQNRIRHLPLVDEEGNLSGVVSIGDVVKALLKDSQYEIRYLKGYIQGS